MPQGSFSYFLPSPKWIPTWEQTRGVGVGGGLVPDVYNYITQSLNWPIVFISGRQIMIILIIYSILHFFLTNWWVWALKWHKKAMTPQVLFCPQTRYIDQSLLSPPFTDHLTVNIATISLVVMWSGHWVTWLWKNGTAMSREKTTSHSFSLRGSDSFLLFSVINKRPGSGA